MFNQLSCFSPLPLTWHPYLKNCGATLIHLFKHGYHRHAVPKDHYWIFSVKICICLCKSRSDTDEQNLWVVNITLGTNYSLELRRITSSLLSCSCLFLACFVSLGILSVPSDFTLTYLLHVFSVFLTLLCDNWREEKEGGCHMIHFITLLLRILLKCGA